MTKLQTYNKTIASVVVGILGWIIIVIDSPAPDITATEWKILIQAAISAISVYAIKNVPLKPVKKLKTNEKGYSEVGIFGIACGVFLGILLAKIFWF